MPNGSITTVILKPTKLCNADCSYCSAPPDGHGKWSLEQFIFYFDRLLPHLSPQAHLIWHGGEPMLMGPDFYWRAHEYATRHLPGVQFGMQTNLLMYDSKRWAPLFRDVMGGRLSTSFDPEVRERTLKGNAELYAKRFWAVLHQVLADGFRPMVIGTYTEESANLAHRMYDTSLSHQPSGFPLRVNYRYPAGRAAGTAEAIRPETYGRVLIELYDRWVRDVPDFSITPIDQMLKKVIGMEGGRCPWTRSCGGRFLGIEPNGDVYNCSEFADTHDPAWCFGNLKRSDVPTLFATRPAILIRRRRTNVPSSCQSCRHFGECEGGCVRDAVLFQHGVEGKFHYCQSWMMVFDRLKASVRSGEADLLLQRYGVDPAVARARLAA